MCKIGICFLDTDFEHDIYELVRAFYPGKEIVSMYGPAEVPDLNDYFLFLVVSRENGEFVIQYESAGEDTKGTDVSGECLQDLKKADHDHDVQEAGGSAAGFTKGIVRAAQIEGQASRFDRNALLLCTPGERQAVHDQRKQNKDILKILLYDLLVKLSGRTLPWGNLTGIRPVKLASEMIKAGMDRQEAAGQMQKQYRVSERKALLAAEIAVREEEILKNIHYENGYSLYLGIPFCPSICLYCSFSSYPLSLWKDRTDQYLDALIREMRSVSALMRENGRRLDTIYMGGGTPTTLEPDQIRRLLHVLSDTFGYDGVIEFTVEAGRPDSITEEKLKALKEFPVSRISVNPQTMNQQTLDLIGRRHTVEDIKKAFYLARKTGFDNINMDLIMGLPGEDKTMTDHTLDEIEILAPDSLTVHSLAVKRSARLNIFRDEYRKMNFINSQEILDRTMETAGKLSMFPYYLYRQKNMKGNFENVGYAKVDKAGIYNILIMEEKQPIIALGAGGSCKLVMDGGKRIERVENVKDVGQYISRIDEMIARKEKAVRDFL